MRSILTALVVWASLTGAAMAETCTTIIDHATWDGQNPWRTVNDGVMGGLSSGGSELEDDHLVFAGTTNTNGGGFSSVRLNVAPGLMADADYLKIWMKPDARRYSVTLRTDVTYRGRSVAFRGDIEAGAIGEWDAGILRLDGLRASIFGRSVFGAEFDPAAVRQIGLIIYDGLDGPFRLDVKRIEACANMKNQTL